MGFAELDNQNLFAHFKDIVCKKSPGYLGNLHVCLHIVLKI